MRLALYQPEIPQNTGTLLRLGSCLDVPIDIIEPCSFIWQDQKLRRAGMDYVELANVSRHASWLKFKNFCDKEERRLVLVDVKGDIPFIDFSFSSQDTLLVGQESIGVPAAIFAEIPHRVAIPMVKERRSLNVAVAAAMVLSEALRQTHLFPGESL